MKFLSPKVIISLYLLAATVTFGQAINENRPERDACVAAKNDPDDCGVGLFVVTLAESVFWPSHVSDILWRRK